LAHWLSIDEVAAAVVTRCEKLAQLLGQVRVIEPRVTIPQ
jgi:hypothetical protein